MKVALYAAVVSGIVIERVEYGKYFAADGNRECNTYYLYKPDNTVGKVGVVAYFHGGAFLHGSAAGECDETCRLLLERGIAFASIDYRLDGTSYYYCDDGGTGCAAPHPAEFVEIDETTGELSLNPARALADYVPRIGRQEWNTQAAWDAVAGLEALVARNDVDERAIGLMGSSAGGSEIHYLAWVWHALKPHFTVRGILYTDAQLNYPVDNALDKVWTMFADDVGDDVLVADFLDVSACTTATDYSLCNATWNNATVAAYCGDDVFYAVTIGTLRRTQVWPNETPFQRGLAAKIWYPSETMQSARDHYATPPLLYVKNYLNGTAPTDFPHHALAGRAYAKVAEAAGLKYVVYHTDYVHMTADDVSDRRFLVTDDADHRGKQILYNFRSNFDFLERLDATRIPRASNAEQAAFFCMAFNNYSTPPVLIEKA